MMENGKCILVTGAAGFIGANLVKRLMVDGGFDRIIGVDSLNDYYDVRIKEYRLQQLADLAEATPSVAWTFVWGNIADKDLVSSLFREYRPAVVVNLAAQAGVRYSITNPDAYIASSSSVYGSNAKVPYSTDDKVDNPISLYAATKKSNELMAHAYSKLYDIPSTGLRFFTVYGPAGRPDMAYFSFTRKILAGETIRVFNYGDQYRDFTYIDDIVEGIMRLLDDPPQANGTAARHRIYNIGNNSPEKLIRFIEILEETIGKPAEKEFLPAQPGDVFKTYADIGPLERDYGFRPGTSLEEGLKRFYEWYRSYYGEQ